MILKEEFEIKKKIVVTGGGIAGLTAGYFLNKNYDITLLERDGRLGGDAYLSLGLSQCRSNSFRIKTHPAEASSASLSASDSAFQAL